MSDAKSLCRTLLLALVASTVLLVAAAPDAGADNACKPAAPLAQSKCTKDTQCCAGLVCDAGHCQAGCHIGGAFQTSGQKNTAANNCQSCQPSVSRTAWTNVAAGISCRASGGECDVGDTCTGTSATCPDTKKSAGTACTSDANPCTLDQCDGTSVTCQHPAGNAGATCRTSAGECDVADTCTGTSSTCPDTKKTAGTACTSDANPCTLDQCDGSSVTCQHPAGNAGVTCRPAAGDCDVAENCTGTSTECPADAFLPEGTQCSGGTCQAGACCDATDCRSCRDGCQATANLCIDSCPLLPGDPATHDPQCVEACRAARNDCEAKCLLDSDCPSGCPSVCDPGTPDFTPCNDGIACSVGEFCMFGVCQTNGSTCHGVDLCQYAWCDAESGECRTADVTCPNVPGTDPLCWTRECQHDAGACISIFHQVGSCPRNECNQDADCNDDDACTNDHCGGEIGLRQCEWTRSDCDDANLCTRDFCDNPAEGCKHVFEDPHMVCDDTIACTEDEYADVSACPSGDLTQICKHTPHNDACDDGDPCTQDLCDPAAGHHDPVTGCAHPSFCDDGIPCTVDMCDAITQPPTCANLPFNCTAN